MAARARAATAAATAGSGRAPSWQFEDDPDSPRATPFSFAGSPGAAGPRSSSSKSARHASPAINNASSEDAALAAAEVVGKKLRDASKNVAAVQNSMAKLQVMADNRARAKKAAIDDLHRKGELLDEKEHELEETARRYAQAMKHVQEKKSQADKLRKELQKSGAGFTALLQQTCSQVKRAIYLNKEVSGNYAVAELAAERGYQCSSGNKRGARSSLRGSPGSPRNALPDLMRSTLTGR